MRKFTATVALTTTLTTNLFNPPTVSGGVNPGGTPVLRSCITKMRVINKTAGSATFSLWRGATGANAAGTEVGGIGMGVAANDFVEVYGDMMFDAADFLVGGASANTTLTLEIEGYHELD